MHHGFCLISPEIRTLNFWGLPHLKPETQGYVLSTETILRDIFAGWIIGQSILNFSSIPNFPFIFTYFQKQRSETNWNSDDFDNTSETLLDTISKCSCVQKSQFLVRNKHGCNKLKQNHKTIEPLLYWYLQFDDLIGKIFNYHLIIRLFNYWII